MELDLRGNTLRQSSLCEEERRVVQKIVRIVMCSIFSLGDNVFHVKMNLAIEKLLIWKMDVVPRSGQQLVHIK